jgi:hypothetical protein
MEKSYSDNILLEMKVLLGSGEELLFPVASGFFVFFCICFSDRQNDSPLVEVKIIALKNYLNTVFYFRLDLFPIVLNLFQACYCFLLQFALHNDIFSLFCPLLNCPGNNSNQQSASSPAWRGRYKYLISDQ